MTLHLYMRLLAWSALGGVILATATIAFTIGLVELIP